MKWIKQLYDWVMHWAETPYGKVALFLLAFAESSFFPIPPDVLLIALCIAVPKKSFKLALICTVASVLGGIAGYFIGYFLWDLVGTYFFRFVPGFTPKVFELVRQKYEAYSFLAVFTSGFTPIPYKVFTISAGVFKINFSVFVVASIAGRATRFLLLAGLIWKFGAQIKKFIDKYFNVLSIVFVLLLGLGFLVIKIFLH